MTMARTYFKGITSKHGEPIEYTLRGEYAVMLCKGDDPHGMHHVFAERGIQSPTQFKYDVLVVNRATGEIVEELSDTIYLSYRSAMEFIESLGEVVKVTRERKQTAAPTPVAITACADYAKVIYNGDNVTVHLDYDNTTRDVVYKRRKTWSHRKYVDKALSDTGMSAGYGFSYGWDMTDAM